jgi:DNA-binding response OmpR family regulator
MPRILVVDDERSIQILYAEALAEEGYDVVATSDGATLMSLIAQEKPDLIVLDIRLGEYNGLDLLQDVRNSFHGIPVILCTAYATFKDDLKSTAADDYVVKSSDLRELKDKVKAALERGPAYLPETETSDTKSMVAPVH